MLWWMLAGYALWLLADALAEAWESYYPYRGKDDD
jgi:hypothetical protein